MIEQINTNRLYIKNQFVFFSIYVLYKTKPLFIKYFKKIYAYYKTVSYITDADEMNRRLTKKDIYMYQ